MNATGSPGFLWYPQAFVTYPTTPAADIQVSNSILTISGTGAGQIGINTAVASNSSPTKYIGQSFGGGGYFEASVAFDPTKGSGTTEWPAFWGEAVQHIIDSLDGGAAEQWPGQAPGYVNFAELDFFEAYNAGSAYTGKTSYIGNIHNWSGIFNGGYADISNYGSNTVNVGSVDWSAFHTYGCLWEPATAGTPGFVQWFFDGIPGPKIYWQGPVTSPPLPTSGANTYSPTTPAAAAQTYAVLDQQQLSIRLSTDKSWPMQVDWVRVWQAP